MGAGSFGVTFLQDQTPSEVIDTIQEWGHIVVTPQEMNPALFDDNAILASARYTGIVLSKTLEEGVVTVSGSGLQLYLGDDRGKGMVISEDKNVGNLRSYTNLPLSSVLFQSSTPYGIMRNQVGNLQAITQGTIYDGSSTYTGSHFVETSLHALKHICEDLGYEFRVNQDATIDAGPASNLFTGVNTDPTTVVVKTGYGDDPTYQGLSPTGARSEFNATDYVTKVDFIAEIGAFNDPTDFEGEASKTSSNIPYYDIHGNKLSRTGLVSVPDMDGVKLDDQAALMLTELSRIKKVLNLDLEQYEVTGDLKVGDFIFAFDPFIGFSDNATDAAAESRDMYEISFRGQQINPIKVRVVGLSFPIATGMGVYFRKFDGTNVTYTDLTPYVSFESGDTQVELGDVLRDISDDLRFNEYSIAARTASAKSIPDLPSTPTLQSGTYLDGTGESKGFIRIVFSKPSNIDGSNITDGSHYRVRYRISDGLSTSGGTSANEYTFKDFPFTGSSTESLVISDLTVGKAYRVGVSTVDTSGFRKKDDYTASGVDVYTDTPSVNANFTTNAIIEIDRDGQAPSKPKQAQSIAAGPLRVQLTHYLGKEGTDGSGNPFGDFTLEGDVDHLDIHAVTQSGNTASFTTNTANKIGEIRVTSGNILQQIPVIGTMELEDSQDYYFRIVAVDKSGNASNPSDGQAALANLIAEANITDATITTAKIGDAAITNAKIADATITTAKISDLSADKITSGTITGGEITVGTSTNTNGFIKSQNYSSGSAGWIIKPDGSAEFQNATIRGSLDAGDITSGTLSVNRLDLTQILTVGEAAGDVNSGSTTIDGDNITTGTITSTQISANTITTNELNFTPFADGDDLTAGTLGGISINAANIQANYSAGSAGFLIESDGDAFFNSVTVNNPIITIGKVTSGTPSAASSTSLKLGDALLFSRDEGSTGNHLFSTKPFVVMADGSEDNPSLTIQGDYQKMGFFLESSTDFGGFDSFKASNGNDDIFSFSSSSTDFSVLGDLNLSAALKAGGQSGSSGQVLQSTGSGVQWANAGGSHADSDHTSFATTTSLNNHTGSTSAHGYSPISINGLTMQHGYGIDIIGTGDISVSAYNSGGYKVEINHDDSDHSFSSSNVSVSAGAVTSNAGYFLRTLSASNNVITYNRSDFGSGLKINSQRPSSNNNSSVGISTIEYNEMHSRNGNFTFVYGANLGSSSQEIKTDITDLDLGLNFINDLTPKKYKYVGQVKENDDKYGFGFIAEDIEQVLVDNSETDSKLFVEGKDDYSSYGRCAHELTCTCEDEDCCSYPTETYNADTGEHTSTEGCMFDAKCVQPCCTDTAGATIDGVNYIHATEAECEEEFIVSQKYPSLKYDELIAPLVKAVQELSTKVDSLTARIEVLEG